MPCCFNGALVKAAIQAELKVTLCPCAWHLFTYWCAVYDLLAHEASTLQAALAYWRGSDMSSMVCQLHHAWQL